MTGWPHSGQPSAGCEPERSIVRPFDLDLSALGVDPPVCQMLVSSGGTCGSAGAPPCPSGTRSWQPSVYDAMESDPIA